MNTTITFKVIKNHESTIDIAEAIEEGFGEFERIVKQYTRFNESSELSNLNRMNGKWVKVTEEFFYLIEEMLKLSKLSNGAFDPTIIDFLEVYGYDKNYDFSKLNNPDLDSLVENIAKSRSSWNEIEMDKENSQVKLEKKQRIDLGGIGKGYAIDCAYKKFEEHGIENFLIDGGGDIRAKGNNLMNLPWSADLRIKEKNGDIKIVGALELKNTALASSGSWARQVKQFHHLINPATGKPQNLFSTIFVEAPTATLADGWATAVFVGGTEVAKKMPKGMKYLTF